MSQGRSGASGVRQSVTRIRDCHHSSGGARAGTRKAWRRTGPDARSALRQPTTKRYEPRLLCPTCPRFCTWRAPESDCHSPPCQAIRTRAEWAKFFGRSQTLLSNRRQAHREGREGRTNRDVRPAVVESKALAYGPDFLPRMHPMRRARFRRAPADRLSEVCGLVVCTIRPRCAAGEIHSAVARGPRRLNVALRRCPAGRVGR